MLLKQIEWVSIIIYQYPQRYLQKLQSMTKQTHNSYTNNLINKFQYQLNYLYSFIMDPPDKKSTYQKQPQSKKYKAKYVEKTQSQAQQHNKNNKHSTSEKVEQRTQNNYQRYNNKQYNQRPRQQVFERPKFVEKQSSTQPSNHCLICSQVIKRRQPIWTCQSCFISLHLRCIKLWIKKTNENRQEDSKKFLLKWFCIQCKAQYNENMPQYYCFCGKFKDPQYQRDLQPHSCGKPCQRKRGTYCSHLCPQLCHSGKCKPCQYEGTLLNCFCGKSQRMVKCSQQRNIFQCGKKCQKKLTCGKHKCERNCHNGQCFPCKKKHLVYCYCGKNNDVVDCDENSYACNQVCGKILNCNFHKCEKDCHDGPCGPCSKTPQLQTTCHCGRYQLMMISQLQRQTCKDPIPSCGMPCKKKLSCGHECTQICHQGRCRECKVIVQQSCKCGTTQRKIQCYQTHVGKQQFHCDTICKKKRNCGIHVCNTQCCKFKNFIGNQGHNCQLTCTKMLNCEKHTCDMPCHAGLCKKCPVIYSQPQPCPCGRTFLKPPVVCGTITPQCQNQCDKLMPCGHKCLNMCHYGSCLCRQQVQVTCRCGNSKIKTICGREALCLNKCQKMLQCGHKCLMQCHTGSCKQAHKEGCFKKCQSIRNDCGHKCKQICHFGKKCDQYPCQAEILIKCQCGHRQTSIICGSQSNQQRSYKKKEILCNKKCENMKRFDILYKGKQIYYSNSLMQFAFKNFNYLQKIQQRLEKFISESDSHFIEIQFKQIGDYQSRMALHNLFQNHYHLNTHYYKHLKTATFTLSQTQNTMIPKPCLTQYIKQVAKGYIKRTNLPFQYTIKFDGQSKQKSDVILKSLRPYLHKYYTERKQKMIYVHFWNKQEALQAKSDLQNQNQTVLFIGQQNIAKLEENQENIQLDQIIQRELTEQQILKNQQKIKQQQKNNQQDMQKKQRNQNQAKQEQNQQKKQQIKPQIKSQIKSQVKQQQKPKGDKQQRQNQIKQQKPKINIIKSPKQGPKIVIRKGAPNFVRSQFPPSSQNVQDIYILDQDQLFNTKLDWDQVIKQLLDKRMGVQASQWRIRGLIMISTFHKFDQKVLVGQLSRIIQLYNKDKQKAKRILQIQKLDIKKIQQQMKGNQIYLSDHQPEIISYCILFNYFFIDKILFQVSQQCSETRQVQRALQIIQNTEQCNYEQFFNQFRNSDYLLACVMIPFVHQIRQNFLKEIRNKRQAAQNLHKYLLFDSEQQLIAYCKNNGLQVGKRMSKSKKIQQYSHMSGQLIKQFKKDQKFIQKVNNKREKQYFLQQTQQLVNDKWMTRSFFAFGDFKQSISPKYMLALCRALKED